MIWSAEEGYDGRATSYCCQILFLSTMRRRDRKTYEIIRTLPKTRFGNFINRHGPLQNSTIVILEKGIPNKQWTEHGSNQ